MYQPCQLQERVSALMRELFAGRVALYMFLFICDWGDLCNPTPPPPPHKKGHSEQLAFTFVTCIISTALTYPNYQFSQRIGSLLSSSYSLWSNLLYAS
jgi:hypothetical protein